MKVLLTMCHTSGCCPQLHEDAEAPPDRRMVITDDFGGTVRMSREQLAVLLEQGAAAMSA